MAAVERIAAWMNGNDSTLILNNDGRLLEKAHRGARFLLVQNRCSGTQALMYALSKNYELVGSIPPVDFTPPELPERNKTVAATKTKKQDLYYDFVKGLIESEHISAKAAFERAAEEFKTTPQNVSTAYYRMKREHDETTTPADSQRRAYAVNRLAVPDELVNIMPMLRASQDAFERVIAWAEAKEKELNERESTIEAREQEAKKRIQEQLNTIFA